MTKIDSGVWETDFLSSCMWAFEGEVGYPQAEAFGALTT